MSIKPLFQKFIVYKMNNLCTKFACHISSNNRDKQGGGGRIRPPQALSVSNRPGQIGLNFYFTKQRPNFWQITLHDGVVDHEFTGRKYQNHEITRLNKPNNMIQERNENRVIMPGISSVEINSFLSYIVPILELEFLNLLAI